MRSSAKARRATTSNTGTERRWATHSLTKATLPSSCEPRAIRTEKARCGEANTNPSSASAPNNASNVVGSSISAGMRAGSRRNRATRSDTAPGSPAAWDRTARSPSDSRSRYSNPTWSCIAILIFLHPQGSKRIRLLARKHYRLEGAAYRLANASAAAPVEENGLESRADSELCQDRVDVALNSGPRHAEGHGDIPGRRARIKTAEDLRLSRREGIEDGLQLRSRGAMAFQPG